MSLSYITTRLELEDALSLSNEYLIVLDFYADWCGPCAKLEPKLKSIQSKCKEENKNVLIYKINIEIEELEDFSRDHEVTALPTILFIKGNEVVNKIEGIDVKQIEKTINQYS
jgi:thioredoxin 1